MKILVVDDSRTMRRMLRKALGAMGYTSSGIIEASDGADALSKLREHDFDIDIVLSDWNMPNMDGLSLLRRLRSGERTNRIPVIMVTGEAERQRVVEAIRAGARNYIVKPFTAETLRQKVLALEMELLGQSKPTKTAVMRIQADKDTATAGGHPPFVAELPEELFAGLYERARMSEHSTGEILIEPDEVIERLHIVERGEVEVAYPDAVELRGRGECIGELSFLSGDPAGLSARASTEVVLASVDKEDFEELLAEYPHMSFYLTRLLAHRGRREEPRKKTEDETGLSGKLSMMAIAELVQTLHGLRKTGVLRIRNSDEEGEIHIVHGDVKQARLGDVEGEEAFYHLVAWSEGTFVFESGQPEISPSLFRATMSLLMEGMRRQDELRRMRV